MSRDRHGRRDEQVLEVRLRGRGRPERLRGIGSSSSAWWSPYASPQIRARKTAAAQEEGRALGAGRWGGRAGADRSVDVHACAVRLEVAWEDVQAVHALMCDIRDATAALQALPAGATTPASRRRGSHGPHAFSSRAMSDSSSPLGRALGSPAVAHRHLPPHAVPGMYVSCVCVCVCVLVRLCNV